MNADAIESARESLRHLRDAFHLIERGLPVRDARKAWGEMLHYSDKIYNQIGAACESNKDRDWHNHEDRLRRKDPFLRYALHARNAEHHGVSQSTERRGGEFDMLRQRLPRNLSDPSEGDEEPPLVLVPVLDRGVTYEVPTSFIGMPIGDPKLLTVALSLEMAMRALVQQAYYIATGKHMRI
jgi:hypothetical protein